MPPRLPQVHPITEVDDDEKPPNDEGTPRGPSTPHGPPPTHSQSASSLPSHPASALPTHSQSASALPTIPMTSLQTSTGSEEEMRAEILNNADKSIFSTECEHVAPMNGKYDHTANAFLTYSIVTPGRLEISTSFIYFIADKEKIAGMESGGKRKDRRMAVWELQV